MEVGRLMGGGLAGCGSMNFVQGQPAFDNLDQIQTDAKIAQTIPTNCGMCQLAKLKSDIVTHSLELSPPLTSISFTREDTEGGMFKVCSAVLERHARTSASCHDARAPTARTKEWHMSKMLVARAIDRL